jgi:hypothetical protein
MNLFNTNTDLFNIEFNNTRRRRAINTNNNKNAPSPFIVGLIIGFFVLMFILIMLFSIFL